MQPLDRSLGGVKLLGVDFFFKKMGRRQQIDRLIGDSDDSPEAPHRHGHMEESDEFNNRVTTALRGAADLDEPFGKWNQRDGKQGRVRRAGQETWRINQRNG